MVTNCQTAGFMAWSFHCNCLFLCPNRSSSKPVSASLQKFESTVHYWNQFRGALKLSLYLLSHRRTSLVEFSILRFINYRTVIGYICPRVQRHYLLENVVKKAKLKRPGVTDKNKKLRHVDAQRHEPCQVEARVYPTEGSPNKVALSKFYSTFRCLRCTNNW